MPSRRPRRGSVVAWWAPKQPVIVPAAVDDCPHPTTCTGDRELPCYGVKVTTRRKPTSRSHMDGALALHPVLW